MDVPRWVIKEFGESVPDSLRQLIERQLERLPETEQELLEVASVAEAKFVVAEVAAGSRAESEQIEVQCERLARRGHFLRGRGCRRVAGWDPEWAK